MGSTITTTSTPVSLSATTATLVRASALASVSALTSTSTLTAASSSSSSIHATTATTSTTMVAMPTMMTTGNYEMKKVKGWHKNVTKDVVQKEYDALPKQALRSQPQLAELMNMPRCTLSEWIRFGSLIVTETTTTNIAEFYKLKKKKKWDNYFQQLVDYYDKHKHTNVTKNCKEYQSIGWWITLQRTSYRKKKLSKDCVSRLESIGFVWDLQVVLSWYEKY